MTPEARIEFVRAQTVCAEIELEAMKAANAEAIRQGTLVPFDFDAFMTLPNKYGIHHNAVLTYLNPY